MTQNKEYIFLSDGYKGGANKFLDDHLYKSKL